MAEYLHDYNFQEEIRFFHLFVITQDEIYIFNLYYKYFYVHVCMVHGIFDIPGILQFLATLMHREVSHFACWKDNTISGSYVRLYVRFRLF